MESNEIKKIIPFDDIWDNLNILEERLLEISSSSNDYLTSISQYLINAGGKSFEESVELGINSISQNEIDLDYLEIVDEENFNYQNEFNWRYSIIDIIFKVCKEQIPKC